MQNEYLPGCPRQLMSISPGRLPSTLMWISRMARPMVALGRKPGPNRFGPLFSPRASRIGPLTMSNCADPPVLTEAPWMLKCPRHIPSAAATTTGRYSGRHPAMTAFTATCPAVMVSRRGSMTPTVSSASSPAAARAASTRSDRGGTTGRPSVRPSSKKRSMAAQASSASMRPEDTAASRARWGYPAAEARAAVARASVSARGLARCDSYSWARA